MDLSQRFYRLLLADDDPVVIEVLRIAFEQHGVHVRTASSIGSLVEELSAFSFDAVVLDLDLGEEDGRDALPVIFRRAPFAKVIALTGISDIEVAADAILRGASALIRKRSDANATVEEVLHYLDADRSENPQKLSGDEPNFGIIGVSKEVSDMRAAISRLAQVDSTVLILGESGSGKELIARGLHTASRRAAQRFEAINCSAIPESLLEAELFGYKRGAFTDAKSDRKGIFEVCSDGTLFLDEVGEMPFRLQAKLLRVLQEKTISPIGSTQSIRINTRIVSATNRDLGNEVRQGRFREDLYYRLSVVPIKVPPLRDRRSDIPQLVEHFRTIFNQRYSRQVAPPKPVVLSRLQAYQWPGNVRELQNAIERGVVLSNDDQMTLENLFLGIHGDSDHSDDSGNSGVTEQELAKWLRLPLTDAKNEFERAYLRNVLREAGGNVSEAARISGRYRPDLYRLMRKYGVVCQSREVGTLPH